MFSYRDTTIYKKAHRKMYNAWACKPPVGTCVLNKFRDRMLINALNGRVMLSSEEVIALHDSNYNLYAQLAGGNKIVLPGQFVISGVCEELNVISFEELQSWFTLDNGEGIQIYALTRKMRESKMLYNKYGTAFYVASDSMVAVCSPRGAQYGVLEWFLVKRKRDTTGCFVYHVSTGKKVYTQYGTANEPGVDHGKGDFLVCESLFGKPDVDHAYIINGVVFAHEFDNRGFEKCVTSRALNLPKPKVLFETCVRDGDVHDVLKGLANWFQDTLSSGKVESLYGFVYEFTSPVELCFYSQAAKQTITFRVETRKAVRVATLCVYNSLKIEDVERLRRTLYYLASLQRKGWVSCFRNAPAPVDMLNAIKSYTGERLYKELNNYLYTGGKPKPSFDVWFAGERLYEYLNKCSFSNITLFRGVVSHMLDVGESSVLHGFTSFSLSYACASNMINGNGVVYVLRASKKLLHGAFIDTISKYHDDEFEVLLKPGYIMTVVRELLYNDSGRVVEITLKEIHNYKFKLGSMGLEDDCLLNEIESYIDRNTNGVGDLFYIKRLNGVWCCIGCYYTDDEIHIEKGNKYKISIGEKTLGVVSGDKLCERLEGILEKQAEKCRKYTDESLLQQVRSFMYNVACMFQNEYYIIISQSIELKKDHCVCKIILSGDNDDNIALIFRTMDSGYVSVSARSQNIYLKKNFHIEGVRSAMDVYKTVVTRFKLNQYRRVEHALKLVAHYRGDKFFIHTGGIYNIGSHRVNVEMSGSVVDITIGGITKSFSYWQDVRSIVSGVNSYVS